MNNKPKDTESQLLSARQACLLLVEFATGQALSLVLNGSHREQVADLIKQFQRLDAKEQKQRAGGAKGAEHGSKGGRPRKTPEALPEIAPWCDSCETLYSESRKSTTKRGGYNVCDSCAADWDRGEKKALKKKAGKAKARQ